MKHPVLITLAAVLPGIIPFTAVGQDGLIASHDVDTAVLTSVDDEILAAMKALDEVGDMLDNPEDSQPVAVNTALPPGLKSFKVDDDESTPVVAVKPEVVPKPEVTASKPEVAPVKQEVVKSIPKTEVTASKPEVTPVKQEVVKSVPKQEEQPVHRHNIQTAPIKGGGQEIAKSAPKAESKTAPKVEPKTESSKKTSSSQKTSDEVSLDYVMANYRVNEVDLSKAAKNGKPSIGELYQYAFAKKLVYHRTTPSVGDLVFFHNTADRNGDGQWNDWHTLVGLVEAVDIDGNQTISVLTWREGGIKRIHLNLKYPELHKSRKGAVLNSQLRQNQGNDKGTAAKMFAGFANLLGNKTSFVLIDNWKPGMK